MRQGQPAYDIAPKKWLGIGYSLIRMRTNWSRPVHATLNSATLAPAERDQARNTIYRFLTSAKRRFELFVKSDGRIILIEQIIVRSLG